MNRVFFNFTRISLTILPGWLCSSPTALAAGWKIRPVIGLNKLGKACPGPVRMLPKPDFAGFCLPVLEHSVN